MSEISLIDIITLEYSLGDKILCDSKIYTTMGIKHINNTCRIFNKITKNEIKRCEEEYYIIYIPTKIEDTIEQKTFSILKMLNNLNNLASVSVYKTPEEYDAVLESLVSLINNRNYDSILARMIDQFKDYVREYYLYDNNRGGRYYMFGTLMNEYYKFIRYQMKHEFKREDFKEDDDDIADLIMSYDYENEE
jgi:hypothetical protein